MCLDKIFMRLDFVAFYDYFFDFSIFCIHGRSLLSNYQFSILPNILIAFCGTHGFIFLVIFDCILTLEVLIFARTNFRAPGVREGVSINFRAY